MAASTASTEDAPPPLEAPAPAWAPLRSRDFRLLCVTQLATGMRTPMMFVTQAWYVNLAAPEDRRVLLLGLLATLRGLVFLSYVVFGGAIADRFPRRRTLVLAHTMALVSTAVTGALLYLPGASEGQGAWLPLFFLLFTAFGLVNAQDLPTRSAMIAESVPASVLTSAVTIFQLSLASTMLIGAPLAGQLIERVGFGTTYLVAGAGHLVVLGALALMRSGQAAADPDATSESVLENMRAGLRQLRDDPVVRWIVLATWVSFTAGISVMGLLIAAWVHDVLALDAAGWGTMMVFWGVGGVLASGTLALRGEYGRKGPLFLGALLVFGLAVLGFGLSRALLVAFLFNGVAGAANQLVRILGIASLQKVVPNRMLGRVMALLMLSQGIAQTFGIAIGALGQAVGLQVLYPAAGASLVLFALALAASQRPLRTLD